LDILQHTAAVFAATGGDILLIGGNLETRCSNFVWACGSASKEFLSHYETLNISLYTHFKGTMEASQIRRKAVSIKKSLQDRLLHARETDEPMPSLETASDAQVVADVRIKRQNQVKDMLLELPNTSSIPMYTANEQVTRRYWQTHEIKGWPLELPTFLARPLRTWSTSLCEKALELYENQRQSWSVHGISVLPGQMIDNLQSQEIYLAEAPRGSSTEQQNLETKRGT